RIGPGYLHAIGLKLLAGRDFDTHDLKDSKQVIIVSETAANEMWSGQSALGQTLDVVGSGRQHRQLEVVGVVRDVPASRLGEAKVPFVYRPLEQESSARLSVVIRTAGSPVGAVEELRRRLVEHNSDIAIVGSKSLESYLGEQIWPQRAAGIVLGILGLLA